MLKQIGASRRRELDLQNIIEQCSVWRKASTLVHQDKSLCIEHVLEWKMPWSVFIVAVKPAVDGSLYLSDVMTDIRCSMVHTEATETIVISLVGQK